MGDQELTEQDEKPAERRPMGTRRYVVRGGRIVEVTVGPAKETR